VRGEREKERKKGLYTRYRREEGGLVLDRRALLLPLYAYASAHSDRGEIAVRHFVCVAVALDLGLGFLLVEEVMDPVHNFVREQSAEQHVWCVWWVLMGILVLLVLILAMVITM
jgi:hypothetical protein